MTLTTVLCRTCESVISPSVSAELLTDSRRSQGQNLRNMGGKIHSGILKIKTQNLFVSYIFLLVARLYGFFSRGFSIENKNNLIIKLLLYHINKCSC